MSTPGASPLIGPSTEYVQITDHLVIPVSELRLQFSRSGGPGGQNVNRRETRVELVFSVRDSPSLTDEQRGRLLAGLGPHLDSQGALHIVVSTRRSQLLNRREAMERFIRILRHGLHVPRQRRPTRPSPRAAARRLVRKRQRSEIKGLRRRASNVDES